MGIAVTLGGADLADRHFDAVCRLYDEVFSEPPFAWGRTNPAGTARA